MLGTCSQLLTGIPANITQRLQSAQNVAHGSSLGSKRYNHVTDALISRQWLRVPERICLNRRADLQFTEWHSAELPVVTCRATYFTRVAAVSSRQRLRSCC